MSVSKASRTAAFVVEATLPLQAEPFVVVNRAQGRDGREAIRKGNREMNGEGRGKDIITVD